MSLTGAPEGWSCLWHICSGCCWCQEGLGLSSQSGSTWSCIRGKATLRKLFLWSPALQSPGPPTLFTGSKFNYPPLCPPPVHSREGRTPSGWHWNVTGCCRTQHCPMEPPPSRQDHIPQLLHGYQGLLQPRHQAPQLKSIKTQMPIDYGTV